jgi:very-short-patch-repair endonuclease
MLQPPLPATAWTRGFFTREEALACGWTARAIRTQLKRAAWCQLASGRYVEAGVYGCLAQSQQHALVALATGLDRSLVIKRDSAACVHNFDVARTPRLVSASNVREFIDQDLTEVHDVLVTTPARTVLDCARFLGPREGLVVGDSALRRGGVSRNCLQVQLKHLPSNAKGLRAAAFVVAEVDARAETAIESISRYEFIAAGLPRAEPNAWLGNTRVDFLWEKYRIIGEADGIGKYGRTDAEVRQNLRAERLRQQQLEDAGYVFVRWLWDEIWRTPHVVVARVMRQLESRIA